VCLASPDRSLTFAAPISARRLLIRPGAIGDFLLALPALECLRAGYTEVWAASRNLSLARFASRARSIPATGLDLLGLPGVAPPAGLIGELRTFDSIVSWYGSARPEFRQAVLDLGLPFEFLPALPEAGNQLHASDFYMRQAAAIAGRTAEAIPRLDCPRGDESFIAIHPFSGSPGKNWPLDRYRQLAELLQAQLPVKWILEPGAPRIEAVDIEPPTEDLYRLACRLACARLYIGNDSGITHLAAASGTRVLALFGPTDPARWAPRGENVKVLSAPAGAASMEPISLEPVASAALGWLAQTGHPHKGILG
jgi:heptosyltransferase-3